MSARGVAGTSGGVTGTGRTLSSLVGWGVGVEGLGGARPEDKIGSDDPVKREAAVAAAATLEKGLKEDFI